MDGFCFRCNNHSNIFEDKNHALLVATHARHGNCVQACIQAGADVNVQDGGGNTPLMLAALNGSDFCFNLLIEAGADVNTPNKDDDTALVLAAGNVDCIQLLIKSGADVNKQCKRGKTALMEAARQGRKECVLLLIHEGTDVNEQDKYGNTCLMFAALEGHVDCTGVLIEAGADVNVVDKANRTALFSTVAGYNCNVDCVILLLRAGSKINCVDIMNQNALQHYVLHYKNVPVYTKSQEKSIFMLLFAAGETIDGTTVEVRLPHDRRFQFLVPDYLLHEDLKLNLKHLCRETIIKHLIKIDPHEHLFYRVPRLSLRSSLTVYLLYNESVGPPISVTPDPEAAVSSGAKSAEQVTSGTKRCIIL